MRFRKTETKQPPVERSRLHLFAAILTGSSVVSLGLTTVALRVLSDAERSELLVRLALKEYIESLKSTVKPPLLFNRGNWQLVSALEDKVINSLSLTHNDTTKIDILGLVADGLPIYTGDYRHVYNNPEGSDRNHILKLSFHGRIGKDENRQTALVGQDTESLENPTKLATISMDSLPTLLTADLAAQMTSERQFVSLDQFDPERKKNIEFFRLTVLANGWLPDIEPNVTFLATDIGNPPGALLEDLMIFRDATPASITSLDKSIDALSLVYLAKTAMALPIAASQSYIVAALQGNEKSVVTRRRFLQLAAGAAVVGGHLAMGNQTGKLAIDLNSLRKQAEMLAWILQIPFQVVSREPEHFIGRVNSFLAKNEQQIPAIAYFLFVRELVTTYKEMAILQTGAYTSDLQSESLSLWGNLHDTKIGLYALSQSELLGYIRQAIINFPTLFRTCFGGSATNLDTSDQFRYLGPHELYTACAYRAEAKGINKEWQIRAVEAWQFPELKAIVESALAG